MKSQNIGQKKMISDINKDKSLIEREVIRKERDVLQTEKQREGRADKNE